MLVAPTNQIVFCERCAQKVRIAKNLRNRTVYLNSDFSVHKCPEPNQGQKAA